MYQISVYIPQESSEAVKEAMFDAGGGASGRYDRCAWQSDGIMQFRPLPGSQPEAGRINEDYRGPVVRVDMICLEERLKAVITAMKKAHPYESPAYSVITLIDI